MLVEFVAFVVLMLGSASMGFEQGQENPEAKNLLSSQSKTFVDDRTYGVDEK